MSNIPSGTESMLTSKEQLYEAALLKIRTEWRYGAGKDALYEIAIDALNGAAPETLPRRCQCGKFAFAPGMALITDEYAHDHVFDGTKCDSPGGELKADAVPEQFCPMCENGVPVARVGRIAFHIDAKHGSRRCLRASQNGGPSHG